MSNLIITIARSYGSGGKTIGKMVAEKKNMSYYDRNLIYLSSVQSGIDIKTISEGVEYQNKRQSLVIPDEGKKYVSKEDVFRSQCATIHTAAEKGNCVFIGRCADYILRNSGHQLLRVFIWAPEEDCLKNIMKEFEITSQEASKMIKQINKHRADYYEYHSRQRWDNARNYDLCINTADYNYEQASELIIGYADIISRLKET